MTIFIPWPGEAAAPAVHQVARSLRFNALDSACLTRTPAGAGNRKTLAMCFRIKRARLGSVQTIAAAGPSSPDRFFFDAGDHLCCDLAGTTCLVTSAVFRDTSGWMDIGFALDVANATAAERMKILVFETEVASYGSDSRASIANANTKWNSTVQHFIGGENGANFLAGYLAEPALVDGDTAIAYSVVDAATGLRLPAAPAATWGTYGFWLPLSDNAAADATHLGADASGNGNNWTPANLSVSAGAGNDSLTDSPTNDGTDTGAGGEVRGNSCTLNPLDVIGQTLTNGNLQVNGGTALNRYARATWALRSGKWYWEGVATAITASGQLFGVSSVGATFSGAILASGKGASYYSNTGNKYIDGSGSAYGATWTANDIIGVALDLDSNPSAPTVTFTKNGVAQGAITLTGAASLGWLAHWNNGGASDTAYFNFGQRPFAHTAPAGFKALSTQNLADTTVIASGTFTGNASADGPAVWLNGVPETLTINGNAVTWGSHADKLASGFKLRTTSASYNAAGGNSFTVTLAGAAFSNARAQAN